MLLEFTIAFFFFFFSNNYEWVALLSVWYRLGSKASALHESSHWIESNPCYVLFQELPWEQKGLYSHTMQL